MTVQNYLKERVDDQIDWYGKKSKFNQRWYKRLKSIAILCSVCIPFLTGFADRFGEGTIIIIGVLGVSIALIEGILSLNKYHELWLEYRKTAELLQREKILFATNSGPYQQEQKLTKLVERCENIMGAENSSWFDTQQQPPAES